MLYEITSSNVIFSGENGLIKIWDWLAGFCFNAIKTSAGFLNDLEILFNPINALIFASSARNEIHLVDWTSPGGVPIKIFDPLEKGKEIVALKRIPGL